MSQTFNNRLRQLFLLFIIIGLALGLIKHLFAFLPGFLGAVTFYILLRNSYVRLTVTKKWNSTWVAILFIITSMILIAIPIFFSVELVSEIFLEIVKNPQELTGKAKTIGNKLQATTGIEILSDENITAVQNKLVQLYRKF